MTGGSAAAPAPVPKTLAEDGVERGDVGLVGDEHAARGPVQAAAGDRAHEVERPGERDRALGRDRDARVVQPAAEAGGERGQVELDRLDAEVAA